jgi:ribosomal-protein-alanine N-acetyltransferase
MTPADMARIHAAAFPESRAWAAREIAGLIEGPGGFAVDAQDGFALGRVIAGEAELLTIAVDPAAQGAGQGRALLDAFEEAARGRAGESAFLEVAQDNAPALALYRAAGWAETGRRPGYYARVGAAPVDAILMSKSLL